MLQVSVSLTFNSILADNLVLLGRMCYVARIITGKITGNYTLCLLENEGIRFRISHSWLP